MRKGLSNTVAPALLAGFVVICHATSCGAAAVTFLAGKSFGIGTLDEPVAAVATDLDGDLDLDLIVANRHSGMVTVHLGDGAAGFDFHAAYGVGTHPEAVAAADFNADDNTDIAVCNGGDGTVEILLGDGSGGFTSLDSYTVGTGPAAIAACWLDEGSTVDLAVACSDTNDIWFLSGNGNGTFSQAGSDDVGLNPVSIVAHDFTSDELSDFVVANRDSNDVSVLLADGQGGFVPTSYSTGADSEPVRVAIEDLDSDGSVDLLVACSGSGEIALFDGDGTGAFTSAGALDAVGAPESLAVCNLDGTSPLDLVVLDTGRSALRVLYGRPGGLYSAEPGPAYFCGNGPELCIADTFDGDSYLDAVVLSRDQSFGQVFVGTGVGTFEGARLYDVGFSPAAVGAVRIDTDDTEDLVVTNEGSDTVTVLYGAGDGTFEPVEDYDAGVAPLALATGQFDGSAGADVAVSSLVADLFSAPTVTVLLAQGDGSVAIADEHYNVEGPIDLGTMDLDGDGVLDLAVVGTVNNDLTVFLGDGTGMFTYYGQYPLGVSPVGIVLGQFDSDDAPDAAITNDDPGKLSVLLGDGDGGFGSVTNFPAGMTPFRLVAARFNSDAYPDLAVANYTADTVTVLLGNGDGTFGSARTVAVGTGPRGLAAADINRDAKTDLVVVNDTSDDAYVLLGNGAGGFTLATSLYAGRAPTAVAAVDLNGDITPDIAVVNFESNTLVTYVNLTPVNNGPPVADAGNNIIVSAGQNVQLDGTGSSDPNGDPLTFEWTQTEPPDPIVSLSDATAARPQFVAPDVSNYTAFRFQLVVNDGEFSSNPATVTVTVQPTDIVPVADAGPDVQVDEGSLVGLDGSSSTDPNDDPLSFSWTQTGGPHVLLSDPTSATPSFSAPAVTAISVLTFELVVSDGTSQSAPDGVSVTVLNSVNEPPTAYAGADIEVYSGDIVVLDGRSSSDPNGDTLTFLWTQTSGPRSALDDPTAAQPQFTAPDVTSTVSLHFELVVDDGTDSSSPDVVVVTVTPISQSAPVADAGPDFSADELALVTLDGTASYDPDGEPLSFDWTQVAGPAVTLSGRHTSMPTFWASRVTSATELGFQLVVSDGTASSLPDTVTVTVLNSVNEPPTADAGDNQTASSSDTVVLDGSSSTDPNNDPLAYQWRQTVGPQVTLSGAQSLTATFVAPVVAATTMFTFQLTVNDGQASSPADSVTVTVLPTADDRPVADAGPDRTVGEQSVTTLDGSGSYDPNGDEITFSWSQTGGRAVVLSDPSAEKPSFTAPDVVGTTELTFSLTVNDGELSSAPDTVTITVLNSVNEPPTADAGTDQVVSEGAPVRLDGTASSDPNGDPLTYEWAQTAGPRVPLTSPYAPEAGFDAPSVASDTIVGFMLTVTDSLGGSATDTVSITILRASNTRPTAEAGPDQTADELTKVTLDGSDSSDPDDDALTFSWTQTEGPSVTLNYADAAQPSFLAPSVYVDTLFVFTLTVSDGTETSLPDTVRVTVHNSVNEPPAAHAGGDFVMDANTSASLDGSSSSDPNGDPLTYSWSQVRGPSVTFSDPTAISPSFTAPDVAEDSVLEFTLTVSDGTSEDDDEVRVTVLAPVDGRPVADAGTNVTVDELGLVTLDGSASYDPDGSQLTYSWQQVAGPSVALEGAETRWPSFTAPEVADTTVFTFRLVVNVGTNYSVPADVTVTVLDVPVRNTRPVADAGTDRNVEDFQEVTLDGSASHDPDEPPQPLAFSWTQTGGPLVTLTGAHTSQPQFTAPRGPAELVFTLTVSDGTDADEDSVRVTVGARTPADINTDGVVDAIDVQLVINAVLGLNISSYSGDVNGDGKLDAIDVQLVINYALGIH